MNTPPLNVILLPNVITENVDEEGNLQPGEYNIAYDEILSFLPAFHKYDGKEWGAATGFDVHGKTMVVYCKVGDL